MLHCYILHESCAFNSPNMLFFQGICTSKNLKYCISGNLCTQEIKAQNFASDLSIQELKMPNSPGPGAQSPHFPRELMHSRAPNAPRSLCLQALAEPTPLLATLPWPLAPLVPVSLAKFWDPPLPESRRERMLLCPSWNVENFHEISCGHHGN